MTVRPSNSTGRNGRPGIASGGTGWCGAATLTVSVLASLRASGSASSTETDHTSSPDSLSTAWTGRSRVDLSKSRTGSTSDTT